MNRAWLGLSLVLIAVACGSDADGVLPPKVSSPTTVSSPTPALTSLVIQGPPTAVGPGQTAQLKAIARYSDGSEREVTAEAIWTSSQPQIATVEGGVIKGNALGRTGIQARLTSRTAFLNVVIQPEGTFVLSGNITEPGGIGVSRATVAVQGGAGYSVTTTTTGSYELFGMSGAVTVRVSNPGYTDEIRMVTVSVPNQRLNIEIRPLVEPSSVAGTYRMVLTISPSCSVVPDDLKTRTYTATISQDNARIGIELSDASFSTGHNRFSGKVSGSTVTFDFGDGYYVCYYGAVVQELVSATQTLGIWGTMVAPTAQPVSGNLVGGFTFPNTRTRGCSASDNRLVFTRK
jgi:hypothetical protein